MTTTTDNISLQICQSGKVRQINTEYILDAFSEDALRVEVDTDYGIDGPVWQTIVLAHISTDIATGNVTVSGYGINPQTNWPDYNAYLRFYNVRKGGYRLAASA